MERGIQVVCNVVPVLVVVNKSVITHVTGKDKEYFVMTFWELFSGLSFEVELYRICHPEAGREVSTN